jgi:hypothetical protein
MRTELFHLVDDPYELSNLVGAPKNRDLQRQVSDQLSRRVKFTGFVIPDYADKPGETPDRAAQKRAGKATRPSREP